MLNIADALKLFSIDDLRELNETNLKKKFRELMRENHPDRGGDEEKAKQINEAYSILKKYLENPQVHIAVKQKQPIMCKIPLDKLYDIYENNEDVQLQGNGERFILNKSNINKNKVIVNIEVDIEVNGEVQKFNCIKQLDIWNKYKIDCKLCVNGSDISDITIKAHGKTVNTTVGLRGKDIKLTYGKYIELTVSIERIECNG